MDETALADIGLSDDHEFEIVSFFADFSVILFVHAFNFIMGKKKQQVKSALVQLTENRTGLKKLPEYIDENFQAKNRWTLIQDFEE